MQDRKSFFFRENSKEHPAPAAAMISSSMMGSEKSDALLFPDAADETADATAAVPKDPPTC